MRDLFSMIEAAAKPRLDAYALHAPDKPGLTYRQLLIRIAEVGSELRQRAIQSPDIVAVVLPPGALLASTCIAVACHAVGAPLNPAYRESEFETYLTDLKAKAIVLPAGKESRARTAATRLGIEIVDIAEDMGTLGVTPAICNYEKIIANSRCDPTPDSSVAFILHTSGTTSRPKMIPLTHRNLWTSAHNYLQALELNPLDRCLNLMPLFHIHGLMAGVIASLAAGASVICPAGFDLERFFAWLKDYHPTWYTAVPAMHRVILDKARERSHSVLSTRLRFIRSSSTALPANVLRGLEEIFAAPVIESYAMTEAASMITSNPLPPGRRKVGSVGMSAGPEIAIMNNTGQLLSADETGEVIIRGDNVMPGYLTNQNGNQDANQNAYTASGWLRTGDLGYLDNDGFLYLTGRLKEMINRGGEKVLPWEVDEVYQRHPAVAQATCFAVPHPSLGEDVALAVVAEAEIPGLERDLREFGMKNLALFKVPSQIVFVNAIPTGPTGKILRNQLSDQLLENLQRHYVQPRDPIEESLQAIWKEVLKCEKIGVDDNFFMLGGDSLLANQIIGRIRTRMEIKLTMNDLFLNPTIRDLANLTRKNLGIANQKLIS